MINMASQPLRSPVSPYEQQSRHTSFSAQSYPTTPQSEPATARQIQDRGLGLGGCRVSQEMPPSPQPSGSWTSSSLMEHAQPPDIFTEAFDPFSDYSANANTGMMSGHSPEAPPLVFCQSPENSNLHSHRSSVSSTYSPSDSFSPNGSEFLYTPKVKVEESSGWYSPTMEPGMVSADLPSYPQTLSPAPTEDVYRTNHSDWPKSNAPNYPISLHDTDGHRLPGGYIPTSVTRTKKKRQRTTPEEATHECRVCGKLFKRSYNYKSHMETHNPERKYPHPCMAMIGTTQCTKKFQRKTDLDRHNDSVSFGRREGYGGARPMLITIYRYISKPKITIARCADTGLLVETLCGGRRQVRERRVPYAKLFSRHTEDGCPKRFELGFREGSAVSPARWSLASNFTPRNRAYTVGGMPQSSPIPPTTCIPVYSRPEFVSTATHLPTEYHS